MEKWDIILFLRKMLKFSIRSYRYLEMVYGGRMIFHCSILKFSVGGGRILRDMECRFGPKRKRAISGNGHLWENGLSKYMNLKLGKLNSDYKYQRGSIVHSLSVDFF
eukprot:TRINITY_DN5843_c1_g1_i4.p1 TRINITY_DN5843_c1_g1~~TRINITY_DN5843_c1_g1_i4.p1  ORF type:complete len:107 (+),score=10.23 TRINITY_DN5843_c1_g1_i4:527-847(+)